MTAPEDGSARGAECSRRGRPADADGGPPPRFVLVETSHPGNIGSTARAMYTMGFADLALVRPLRFPHADATALAAGADNVLARCRIHDSLADALADCRRVFATSARSRALGWPLYDARAAAAEARVHAGPVAFVFGRERTGLTNAELDLCDAMVTIPTAPGYASLNIAQAVQIVAYELRMTAAGEAAEAAATHAEGLPTHADMERFHTHLEATLVDIGFLDPANPRQLMRRLRRYFRRSAPSAIELSILRGILRNARDPEPGSATRGRIVDGRAAADDADGSNSALSRE